VWGEDIKKAGWRVNMMELFCTMHINGKMRPVEIIPGMEEEGMKKNDGGGEFDYDTL
jgi:hypothetical protein